MMDQNNMQTRSGTSPAWQVFKKASKPKNGKNDKQMKGQNQLFLAFEMSYTLLM